MKKKVLQIVGIAGAVILCAGCGGSKNYADGVYTGTSSEHVSEDGSDEEGNGYGVVTVTIQDNVICDCTYQTYKLDGTLKDENYGESNNTDFYRKAQKAVAACDEYAAQLVEAGSLSGVDKISGATINYEEFQEAVKEALRSAEE